MTRTATHQPAPLYRVTAPYFCAGFVLGQHYAPIIHYMRGWSVQAIERYCKSKGWTLERIDPSEANNNERNNTHRQGQGRAQAAIST